MTVSDQRSRAAHFRDLHLSRDLVLPNAWDAASARIFETAGFTAIGTTSAGIAYARGFRDAERIDRETMVREIATITAAVAVPVTADIEAGYGPSPVEVAETVDAVMDIGVAGINLEDATHGARAEPLFDIAEQTARIAAAREVADRRGVPLVINARTDTFLLDAGKTPEDLVTMTVTRGRAYLEAGADLIFIPVLTNPDVVRRIATAIAGPISLMAMPGAPSAAVWFAAGACRVSLGQMAMLATLGALRIIAQDIRDTGAWKTIEHDAYSFSEAEAMFADR